MRRRLTNMGPLPRSGTSRSSSSSTSMAPWSLPPSPTPGASISTGSQVREQRKTPRLPTPPTPPKSLTRAPGLTPAAAGAPWPHSGWWGRPESLRPPFVMAPGPALPAFAAAWRLPGAHLVMMTGRREFLRPEVRAILQQFQVSADYEILNDTRLDTFSYKAERIRRMCAAYRNLREVVIWEDRPEHSRMFCTLAAEYPRLRWRVVTVHPQDPHVVDAFNGVRAAEPSHRHEQNEPKPAASLVLTYAYVSPDSSREITHLLRRAGAPADESLTRMEHNPAASAAAAAEAGADEFALPRFSGSGGYERYCIPVPPEAAAVPQEWVRAKEARDGAEKKIPDGDRERYPPQRMLVSRRQPRDIVASRVPGAWCQPVCCIPAASLQAAARPTSRC